MEEIDSTDRFRPLDDVLEPDRRQLAYAVCDESAGGWRTKTLEDQHAGLAQLELRAEVPREVQVHFDTARNLLLHAWFVYRFIQVAEAHVLASLEMALKLRLTSTASHRSPGLKRLMMRAVAEGLVKDRGFRHLWRDERRMEPSRAGLSETAPRDPELAAIEDPTRYARILVDALPSYRNQLAHGSRMLAPGGYIVLSICCDLINQLFAGQQDSSRK